MHLRIQSDLPFAFASIHDHGDVGSMFAHGPEDDPIGEDDDDAGENEVGEEHDEQEVTVGRLPGEVVNATGGAVTFHDVPRQGMEMDSVKTSFVCVV